MKKKQNQKWFNRFFKVLQPIHKQFTPKTTNKLLKILDGRKNSLVARSKKQKVLCDITIDQLRTMVLKSYGKPCEYCERRIVISNFNIDHKIPISYGGPSTVKNLKIICQSCNRVKGSMSEAEMKMLLDWLDTMPEYFSKNILRRLAGSVR